MRGDFNVVNSIMLRSAVLGNQQQLFQSKSALLDLI